MNNNFFNQNIFKPEEKKDQPFQQNLFGQQQPNQNFNQPFQQTQFYQSSFAQSPFQPNNPSQFNQSSFAQSPFTTQQKPLFQSSFGENKPLFNQQSTIHSFPYSQSFDLDVKKGTNKPKYTSTRQKEMGSYEYQTFIDITLMSDYKDKSTFELRLEDYSLGRKPAQSAVNSFGAMTKENKPLGLGGSSIFSSTTPSSFTPSFTSSNLNTSPSMTTSNLNPSSMSQTGSLFTSSAPSSSIFSSNTTPTSSIFNQPTSSFSPSTLNTPTTSTFSSSNLTNPTPLSTANPSSLNQTSSLFTGSTPSTSIFTPSTPTFTPSSTQNINTGTTSMFNTPQTISSGFTQTKPSSSLFPTSTSVFNQPTPIQPSFTSTFTQPSYTSSNFVQNEVKVSDQIAQYVEAKIKRDPYSLEELNLEEFKEEEILPVKKFTKPKFIKKSEEYIKLDLREKSTKPSEIETIPSQDSLPKLSNVNLIILFKEGKLEYLESVKANDCYLENIQTKLFFSKETVKCLDPIGTGLNKRCRVYVYNVVSDCGIERFVWGLKSCKNRKFVEYDQNEMVYVYEVEHL